MENNMETSVTDSASGNQPVETPVDPQAIAQEARELLSELLRLLSFTVELTVEIEKENVRIRMKCEDAGRLIGRRGSTVNEIQFLVNRILQRRHKTVPRVFLDVDGPQEQQQERQTEPDPEVVTRVQLQADQVRRWGDPVDLGSVSPEDRAVLLNYFAKDREIEIVSLDPHGDPTRPQRMQLKVKG